MCCCAEKLGIPCLNSRGFYFSLSMGLSSVAFHSEKSFCPTAARAQAARTQAAPAPPGPVLGTGSVEVWRLRK